MNKTLYNVNGLLNEQVKAQVKHVLSDIDGVSMVNVDLLNSTIEVGFKEDVDPGKIEEGIERVGCKIL
ncbi:MAG: hypothetical protein ACFWTJ_11910 [Lachnoclostridium sp.]|jgi:copper chaperone